jgi:hypothetical protein
MRIRASGVRVKRNLGIAVSVTGRFELQAELLGEYTTVWTSGEATLESHEVFEASGLLFNAIVDAYVTMNSEKAYLDNRALTMVSSSRKIVEFYEKPSSTRSSFSLKSLLKM